MIGYLFDLLKNKIIPDTSSEHYRPDALRSYGETFVNSMNSVPFEGKDIFETYVKEHQDDEGIFGKIKINDLELSKQLHSNTDNDAKNASNKAIKQSIRGALKLSDDTARIQKQYKQEVEDINNFIQNKDSSAAYPINGLITRLHELKDECRQAIADQHKNEQEKLEAVIDNDDFKSNLKTSLGIDDDEEVESFKNKMLAELKATQKKELDKFDKSMNEQLNRVHQEASKEVDRVLYLAALYKNNKAMREIIDNLVESGRNDHEGDVTLSFSESEEEKEILSATLKGVKIEALGNSLKTISGHSMQHENGEFTINMGFFDFRHNTDLSTRLDRDLQSLAMALKASGYEKVKMKANHTDPEKAMRMGRKAFEACRLAGYKPEDIKVLVNGEVKTADQLFKDSSSKLSAINTKASLYDKQRKELKDHLLAKDFKYASGNFRKRLAEEKSRKAETSETSFPGPNPG